MRILQSIDPGSITVPVQAQNKLRQHTRQRGVLITVLTPRLAETILLTAPAGAHMPAVAGLRLGKMAREIMPTEEPIRTATQATITLRSTLEVPFDPMLELSPTVRVLQFKGITACGPETTM